MKITKRNHFVPQCHLAGFVDEKEGNRLFTYDKIKEEWRHLVTREIGFQNHLYTLPEIGGLPRDALEQVLADLDGRAAPLLFRLRKGNKPETKDDWNLLVLYSSYLHVRNIRGIRAANEIQTNFWFEHSKDLAQDEEKVIQFSKDHPTDPPTDPDTFLEMMRKPEDHYQLKPDSQFSVSLQFMFAKDVGDCISVMKRTIFEAPQGHEFILSDVPLNSFVPSKDICGSGFGLRDVEISIPISPKYCLLYGYRSWWSDWSPVQLGKQINKRQIWGSEREIYCFSKYPYVETISKRAKDTVSKTLMDPEELARRWHARSIE